jgi:hypothetical protein
VRGVFEISASSLSVTVAMKAQVYRNSFKYNYQS